MFNIFYKLLQMVCTVFGLYTLSGVGTGAQRKGLAILIGLNRFFYLKVETESSF
jgi:hypothetical protein